MHNWRANLQQLDEKSTHWANKIKQKTAGPERTGCCQLLSL